MQNSLYNTDLISEDLGSNLDGTLGRHRGASASSTVPQQTFLSQKTLFKVYTFGSERGKMQLVSAHYLVDFVTPHGQLH